MTEDFRGTGEGNDFFVNELQDLLEQREVYGFGCGGFPIQVKGQGIVGAVALSGLPDPADHLYVVKALEEMLGVKVPAIPSEVNEEFVKP